MNRKTGCLFSLIALVALGAYLFWSAKTPPRVGEDFARLAPAQKQEHRQEAQKLKDTVETVVRASRNNEHKPFVIQATEEQLNTLLQDNLRIENFPISALRIGLEPNELALQGMVNYKGFNAVVTVRGNIVVENAKLRYDIASLQIGGLPAPASLRKKAESGVTGILNKNLAKAPGTISGVEIADKTLTISGTTN